MVIATHQPNFIPWLGYFYKIFRSDIFVYLDDVQFSKTGAHNYHYLRNEAGTEKIKVPVTHSFHDSIKDVKIKNNDWQERHLGRVKSLYSRAPYFNSVYIELEELLHEKSESLLDLNVRIINHILGRFELNETKFIYSSSLNINARGEERIIKICKAIGGSVYYSGKGAKAYQNEQNFLLNGLKLVYDNFSPIKYNQLFPGFESNVSVIDFIMNNGYDWELVKANFSNPVDSV